MPKPCPACNIDHVFAESFRREPAGDDEGSGHGFAWIMGAAHVIANSAHLANTLCEPHRRELDEEIEDAVQKARPSNETRRKDPTR